MRRYRFREFIATKRPGATAMAVFELSMLLDKLEAPELRESILQEFKAIEKKERHERLQEHNDGLHGERLPIWNE